MIYDIICQNEYSQIRIHVYDIFVDRYVDDLAIKIL